MKIATPQFKHDCKYCTFLGRFSYRTKYRKTPMRSDLYHCPGVYLGGSLIARVGNRGDNYSSLDIESVRVIKTGVQLGREHSTYSPALIEALRRKEQGGM